MKFTKYSVSNHATFYGQYTKLIEAKHTLITDRYMHWCEENKDIERLRSIAEKAVSEYLSAVSSVYYEEEREFTEHLCKKKTIF